MPLSCCVNDYIIGTYRVIKGGRTVLSASNTKYLKNFEPVTLQFSSTLMGLTPEGDQGPDGNSMVLDIPGAYIKIENGRFYGDFDTATLPTFIDGYRGECAFYMDPKDGYFAVMIACSFPITPVPINVEGETYFFHAPRNELNDILERAADWAIYHSADDMKTAIGMTRNGIGDQTVVSGALTCGNGARGLDLGPINARVRAGGGFFFYRYENPGGSAGYNYGLFQNCQGRADLKFLSAEVVFDFTADIHSTQGAFDSVRSYFRNSDLVFELNITASACATCKLAYAMIEVDLDAHYSVRNGFGWDTKTLKAKAGLGGC